MDDKAAREIAAIFNEVVSEKLVTKTDLERAKLELKIWVTGLIVTQTGLIFAMFKLLK